MAAKQKKLPIGIDRFAKLRNLDCYYVDKTGMIKEMLDEADFRRNNRKEADTGACLYGFGIACYKKECRVVYEKILIQ